MQQAEPLQCIIIKAGQRCGNTNQDYGNYGVTLPIIKPNTKVFICGQCIDDLHFVAHQVEARLLGGLDK